MRSEPPSATLKRGTLFEDKYRIVRELGRGGFGYIYLAEQLSMDRPVALKVLRPDLAVLGATPRKRFMREIKIINKLNHPNTVTIYDYGQTPGGVLYMVLEYVDGETLQDLLDREGPQPPIRSLTITRQIARSLDEAHAHDVVHRDLKPENIMLSDVDGEGDFVKVLDFGVASLRDTNEVDLTSVGVPDGQRSLMGTPRYMSPEQVRGEELSAAADIYSLGLLCYELLTGQPAVGGDTVLELIRVQNSPDPLDLPGLDAFPTELVDLIRRATEKSRDRRFHNGDQLVNAIDKTLQSLRPPAQDAPTVQSPVSGTTGDPFFDDTDGDACDDGEQWGLAAFSADDFDDDDLPGAVEIEDTPAPPGDVPGLDKSLVPDDRSRAKTMQPPPALTPQINTKPAPEKSSALGYGAAIFGLCLLAMVTGLTLFIAYLVIAALLTGFIDGRLPVALTATVLIIIPVFSALLDLGRDKQKGDDQSGPSRIARGFAITTIIASGCIVIISLSKPAVVTQHLREDSTVMVHSGYDDDPSPSAGLTHRLSLAVAEVIESTTTALGRFDEMSPTGVRDDDQPSFHGAPPETTRPATRRGSRDEQDDVDESQPAFQLPGPPPPTRPATRGDETIESDDRNSR